MVSPRILVTAAATLAFCANVAFSENFDQYYSQAYQAAKPVNMEKAPKYASWRSGSGSNNYQQSNNYRQSDYYGDYQQQDRQQRWGWFSGRSGGKYQDRVAQVPKQGPANAKGTIVFSPKDLTYGAYDSSGNLVKAGRASGGNNWCHDIGRSCHTPVGHFKVHTKGPEDCISRTYPLGEGGARMPHCTYFTGGYALHGSYDVPNFNASHGCVRLHPGDAEWLYHNFTKVGTNVIVKPYH